MEKLMKRLEGIERITKYTPYVSTVEDWKGESSETFKGEPIITSLNVEITTVYGDEEGGLWESEHGIKYAKFINNPDKLEETHSEQLDEMLQRFNGWKILVRIEPMIRRWFDPAENKEHIKIYTRLVVADLRGKP